MGAKDICTLGLIIIILLLIVYNGIELKDGLVCYRKAYNENFKYPDVKYLNSNVST